MRTWDFAPLFILIPVAIISVAFGVSKAIQVFKDGLDSQRQDDD